MAKDFHKPYFWYLVISAIGVWLTHTKMTSPSFGPLLAQGALLAAAVVAFDPKKIRSSLKTVTGFGGFVFIPLMISFTLAQVLHADDVALHREYVETLLILSLFLNREEWPRIRRSIALFAVALTSASVVLLLADGVVPMPHLWWSGRMIGVFSQPNQTGAALAMTLPFVLTADFMSKYHKALVIVVIGVLIALTRSRTSAGIAAAVVALFVLKPWTLPWRPSRPAIFATIVVGLMLSPFFDDFAEYLSRGQDSKEIASLTGRTAIWMDALMRIQSSLLAGVGSAASHAAVWSRETKMYWETSGGAHNFYLAQALTYGVPHAALISLALLSAVWTHLLRLRRAVFPLPLTERSWLTMALPGTLIFSATEAGAAYPMYLSGQLFWLLLIHAVFSEKAQTEGESEPKGLRLVEGVANESA